MTPFFENRRERRAVLLWCPPCVHVMPSLIYADGGEKIAHPRILGKIHVYVLSSTTRLARHDSSSVRHIDGFGSQPDGPDLV
jgi:hypothetical protein